MTNATTIAEPSRRSLMMAAGSFAAAASLPAVALSATKPGLRAASHPEATGKHEMTTVTTKDGTKIFYKDWGTGRPIVFSHGWPLTADAWDSQMLFFGAHGFRVIAHDRRGHGRSDQTWDGNDMDTYADDLATLLDSLAIKDAVMIGHSTGGGEVARYIGRHGTARVTKAVLISSVPPHMANSPTNPHGAPMSVFDGLRDGVTSDRSGFFKNLALPFFNYNRPNAKVSQGVIDSFWMQGMEGGIKSQYDCIKAFSETDFTEDLKKMSIPTLVMQGDDDQIVPIQLASLRTAKIVPQGSLKVYPGAPHGLCVTHSAEVNADILAYIQA